MAAMMDQENAMVNLDKKKTFRTGAKRDFFGRVINEVLPSKQETSEEPRKKLKSAAGVERDETVWCSFHEGFSNAVRKPITLAELLSDL